MYGYLLMFTVLCGLVQVALIMEPDCITKYTFENTRDIHDDGQSTTNEDIGQNHEHNSGEIINQNGPTLKPKDDPKLRHKNRRVSDRDGQSKTRIVDKRQKTLAFSNSKIQQNSTQIGKAIGTQIKETSAQCRRSILVFGGIKIVRKWTELHKFVDALKPLDDGDWLTEISCDSCTVQLVLSNRLGNIQGKDAVVFGMSPYSLKVKMSTLPTLKFEPRQLLVFYAVETPLRMRKWIPDVGSTPNHVVWSYATTADIHLPYGYYKPGTPLDANRQKPSDRTHGKEKLIAWMASNCLKEVFWPRMNFVWKLQTHIPVDVYGKCGNLTCLPRLSEECQNLMGKYKFYLSLENAECDDYVTEKFWETALKHQVVPVVYGAPKEYYTRNAPPNSFIYAGDFKTEKQLADYLTLLDRNPKKYAKYFEWRYMGTVIQNFPDLKLSHFCSMLPYISKAAEGQLTRRTLSETPWFNSCRNMRMGENAFIPTDVNSTNWIPW